VLAGLKPDIILDICSRAIAFYEYQTSQELNFRSILQKSTEEKYNLLKGQYDIVTRDLNHIIKGLFVCVCVYLCNTNIDNKNTMCNSFLPCFSGKGKTKRLILVIIVHFFSSAN
jgi:hypothetical protein